MVGGRNSSEGNVFAYNPKTKIDGPVCDDDWDLDDVSLKKFKPFLIIQAGPVEGDKIVTFNQNHPIIPI